MNSFTEPCPNCGADAFISHLYRDEAPRYWVQCQSDDCGLAGPYAPTEEEAARNWAAISVSD